VDDASMDTPDTAPACVPAAETCDGSDQDCDGSIDEDPDLCAPCTRVTHVGRSYLFCPRATWDAGRGDCRARGYDLVVIDDAAENGFIWDTSQMLAPGTEPWLGLGDHGMNGTYTWVDGTVVWRDGAALGYVDWRGDVPEDTASQECVQFDSSAHWADEGCGSTLPVICEQTSGS
jgi:hypothetical protein